MKSIAAATKDVHGHVHLTCHFVAQRQPEIARMDPDCAHVYGSRQSFDALGLLGVHVYLPEMSWAKRVVQREIARAAVLDDARAVREAMRAL